MLRRVSTSFAAQVWALLLNLADRLILVGILLRVWGTDLYADWVTIFAAANLISMGELGLNVYLGNAWQRAFAHKDELEFQRLLSIFLSIYLVLTFVLMTVAAGFFVAGDLGNRLSLQVVESNVTGQVFLILAAAFALRVMRGSISQIYRGRGQFAAGTMINSLSTAALIVSVTFAAYFGASLIHIALIYLLIDSILGSGVMVYDLQRRFPQLQFSTASPEKAELTDMVKHGKWYAVLQAAPIAWLHIPVLLISGLGLGGLAVVSFVVLRTLVNFTRQVPEMLARSVGVESAGDFHLGDRDRLSRIFHTFGPFLSALTGAFAGGLFMFALPLAAIWTGDPGTYNPWIVFWLLLPSILVAPATPLRIALTLGNLPRPVAVAQIVQLFAGLPVCYILAKAHGIEGLMAGLAVGEALAHGILLPVLGQHHVGLDYFRYFIKCVFWFGLTTFWAGFTAWILLAIIGAGTPLSLAYSASLWAALGLFPAVMAATPSYLWKRLFR